MLDWNPKLFGNEPPRNTKPQRTELLSSPFSLHELRSVATDAGPGSAVYQEVERHTRERPCTSTQQLAAH